MRTLLSNLLLAVAVFIFMLIPMAPVPNGIAQTTAAGRRADQQVMTDQQETRGTSQARAHPRLAKSSEAEHVLATHAQSKQFQDSPLDGNLPLPLFAPAVTYDQGAGVGYVAIADVNGDRKPDVVATTYHGVAVLLGNGDGTLQSAVNYSSGGISWMVAVADVNRDGKPDIVVANGCGDINCLTEGSVGVLLGNGDGTFQPVVSVAKGFYSTLAVGDFNGDGKLDIAATNFYLGTVDVLLGNGDGTFHSPVSYDTGGAQPSQVIAADLNRDGHTDLLVVNNCNYNDCMRGRVGVLLGNGDGTFQPAVAYGAGDWPVWGAVADLNGDGIPDLAVVDCFDTTVGVLLGNGDGTFQPAAFYHTSGSSNTSIAVADVNGDGKPDLLVVGDLLVGTIDILLGNGDGTFQLYISESAYRAGSLAVADLDGDGNPDLAVGMLAVGVMLHVGDTPTTTSMVTSLNPSVFGQPITLTATVGSSSGTPTGMVYFYDSSQLYDNSKLGSATLVNGSGSISVSSLWVRSHPITAVYQGSAKYNSSESATLTQVVNMATTTTALTSSLNPAGPGHKVTYTAKITGQYGGPATGNVTFQDGGSTVATVKVNSNNRAGYTTSYQSLGTHAMTATYSGDFNNSGSTSRTLTEQIVNTTSTTLATSGSPTYVGQPVTFTATIKSNYGTIPDGELVTFYDGATPLASVALAGGKATYTTSSLSAKPHVIKAAYPGDATFWPSSGTVKQLVLKYTTTTSLTSNPNPSNYGQAVTFTARVTSAGPTPTGIVRFNDGTTFLGAGALSSGTATLTTSKLAVGTHSITAVYLGDSANAKSTSAVLNQVVQ